MIKFQALMQAIHQSIQSAAKLVEAQGVRHIERFFDVVKEPISEDEQESGVSYVKFEDEDGFKKLYRPKTFTMEFPSRTPDGVEKVEVNVPLITLSPVTTPTISEVKFITELEVGTDENNELMVSFPGRKRKSFFGGDEMENSLGNTKIEISIKSTETPEGLKKLIEGYERALRAQIPG